MTVSEKSQGFQEARKGSCQASQGLNTKLALCDFHCNLLPNAIQGDEEIDHILFWRGGNIPL